MHASSVTHGCCAGPHQSGQQSNLSSRMHTTKTSILHGLVKFQPFPRQDVLMAIHLSAKSHLLQLHNSTCDIWVICTVILQMPGTYWRLKEERQAVQVLPAKFLFATYKPCMQRAAAYLMF